MVLRRLKREDIPAAKNLWTEAFGDSEEFVRYYFANKLKLKNTMGAFIKDELVGDITMQEMLVHMRGADLKTGFLAGCATREAYRNQGVMQKLLFAQMQAMDKGGYAICHLHPFLHAFYRKFGWETVSYMRSGIKEKKDHTGKIKISKETPPDFDRIYNMYSDFCKKAEGYFIRTPQDMYIRMQEHATDGGGILVTDGAYVLYFEQKDKLEVIEFVWRDERARTEMLDILIRIGLEVKYYTPDYAECEGELEEYTMMRVVNARRLLENLPLRDCRFTIEVHDEFLPWNNVSFVCTYTGGHAETAPYSGFAADVQADVRDLAQLSAGKTVQLPGVANEIFEKQRTIFFNTY